MMRVLTCGTWKSGYAHPWKNHCMEQSWIHRQLGARGGVGRGRLPRYDLCEAFLHFIFLINSPHLIFPDFWHKTESSSVSLRICLGQK